MKWRRRQPKPPAPGPDNVELPPDLYPSLDSSTRQFRLVRISGETSRVEVEMQAFSVDDPPVYRALSYCWTTASPTYKILLNGVSFKVRPNLHAFLQQVIARSETGWFFIDALCINQNDLAERGHQVAFMGNVYGSAEAVVVWTGVSPWEGKEFGDQLATLQELATVNHTGLASLMDEDCTLIPADKKEWLSAILFTLFVKVSYWSRLWIVQEVCLARNLVFWCGRYSFTETEFQKLMDFFPLKDAGYLLTRNLYALLGLSDAMVLAYQVFCIRRDLTPDTLRQGIPLSMAMTMFAEHRCEKIHDKIFGLQGITRFHISPDYTMLTLELFLRSLVEAVLSVDTVPMTMTTSLHGYLEVFGGGIFLQSVVASFGFSVAHPVIYIICEEVWRRSTARPGAKGMANFSVSYSPLEKALHVEYNLFCARLPLIGRPIQPSEVLRRAAEIRCKTTKLLLEIDKATNRVITINGPERMAKTYKEWVQWTKHIADDVERKMDEENENPNEGLPS